MPSTDFSQFERFLRFRSVSSDPAHAGEVAACAGWLAERFRELGLTAAVHPTPRHPVVLARTGKSETKRTLLVYGHYDVQPAEPDSEWTSPPFEPAVRDGRVWARGASDDKGPVWAFLQGLAELLRQGTELPLNLIFLIEGEEEIGCPHLLPFIESRLPDLSCDFLALSDTELPAVDRPALTYAMRGGAGLAVTAKGPAKDLHSGFFGGVVRNPAEAMALFLSGLHDPATRAVAVPGFYEAVREPEDWEKAALEEASAEGKAILAETGAAEEWGEKGRSILERIGFRPTAEIISLCGGYVGPGRKAIVPARAEAKVHFRLTPAQTVADCRAKIERWARARQREIPGVEWSLEFWKTGDPFLMDPRGPAGVAARRALRSAFGREPLLLRSGGSIGVLPDLQRVLKVDPLLLGLHLPDANLHAPNENFHLELLDKGAVLFQHLVRELAG